MGADVVSLHHEPRSERRQVPRGRPPFDARKVCAAYFQTLVEQTGLSVEEYAEVFSEALGIQISAGMVQRYMDGRGPCFPADWGVIAKWLAGPDPAQLRATTT